jgi:hypothetical protein
MANIKILIVVDSINVEDSSGSKANVALIKNLVEAGFEVSVYHYTLKDIQLSGVSCFAIPEIKLSYLYYLSRLQRVIWRNFNINLAPFLQKIFGFSFTFFNDTNSIKKALKKINFTPDLVITLSKGASFRTHYAVLQLPQYHDKWMAYVHDPYPMHCYPRPYDWVESSYKQKQEFFRLVSEKARFSSFPSQLLKEWMGSYFPNFLKTGIIIPHQNADYKINDVVLPDYFDNTKFNLLHAGNLMLQRSPKGLIEGYKLFLKNNPEAKEFSKLILIGPASSHSKMLEEYQLNNTEIYIYNGTVPFDTVYKLQKNVTVNIILESKSEISPFLPGKFPHCVEANKPIISLAPYYSEVKRVLGEKYPYWAEVDDVSKIATIIEILYTIWKINPDDLALNRKDVLNYLSSDYLKKVINDLQKAV